MNAKHCFVSQVVLSCVIRVVGAERLVAMRKLGQVLPGLLAYSERHHSRISKIRQAVSTDLFINGAPFFKIYLNFFVRLTCWTM